MHKQGEGVHVVAVPDGFELSIVATLSDKGVRISTRSGNSTLGRLRVETSCDARHLRNEQRESIRGVFEVSIVAALSDRGVRYSSRSRKSSNGGRPRVEVRFKARHLLKEQRENTLGGIEIAVLRAWVGGNRR